jgi:hypothetical protein
MSRSELWRHTHPRRWPWVLGLLLLAGSPAAVIQFRAPAASGQQQPYHAAPQVPYDPFPMPEELAHVDLLRQTPEEALAKSAGCIQCHQNAHDPHYKETVHLGCCDCHGGNPHTNIKEEAHVPARYPDAWPGSANPVRSYTLLNHESPDFIRFVNPGDLRVAHISCGTANCHPKEVLENRKSMMTHGCMLWGAALYNNGALPVKWPAIGESYSMNGAPQRLQTVPPPTEWETSHKGILPYLDPFPRFEISQPGNILRIFERGGRFRSEVGIPNVEEEPGRPFLTRLSVRGLGTQNRTDPTVLGAQKTRLFDPTLHFLGTNDQPGDYRSSGCTACHVVYANDRSPINSGAYARFGNLGHSFTTDPTIPKNESGHPIEHRFTTAIPTSQCIVCHMHPGTNVLNSYTGYMWWDEETDGELIYPREQKYPTAEEYVQTQLRNPNESATRNNLADPAFVARLAELNTQTKHTQFADYHGHGWAFRAVFKKDRHGHLLDRCGNVLKDVSNEQLRMAMDPLARYQDHVPVHQLDIHLEKGMHCIDCHFIQDCHGNTKLYGEVRAAIEIQCIDCHGSINGRATLKTTGPAACPPCGRNLEILRTPCGKRRFVRRGDRIFQRSMVDPCKEWEVPQVLDTITPGHPRYNEKSHLAKTVRMTPDGKMVWGDVPLSDCVCAHQNKNMSCIACHSAWNPSCFGCHLPQKANMKTPMLHNEGDVTRNQISYNFQTLRDDVYMLARDGDVTGNRIGPARSSCAVHVGSYNANRESIYVQQQTISAEGMSGIAFSTNVPHTVRGKGETKLCTDCHVSNNADDNNAIMAQLLMHGTQYVNFIGKYCWVAAGRQGLDAVVVTERDEPQAVIGSYLHELAFPDFYQKHLKRGGMLDHIYHHPGKDIGEQVLNPFKKPDVKMVQARGEYLYAACGEYGVRVFDISMIDHKGFSERVFTAPVSPLGQRFFVRTRYAMAVAAPTTMAPDPTRTHMKANREQPVHPMYGNIYIADRYEGLIVVGAATTINGNPLDNFLRREATFNPNGILAGASNIGFVGTLAYVLCDAGIVIVDLNDPKHPEVKGVLGPDVVKNPKALATQFRYAYFCDDEGIKVLDITHPTAPVPVGHLDLPEANGIYVARTYAYVAAGSQGLVILDIEQPAHPRVDQVFTADGVINDLHDVKLGITYTSEFAYLADGRNGMRVVQLTNPDTPGNMGFSPRPTPKLIATARLPHGGQALYISKGLDRDRAVDESGNQIGVFGRVGARPFNLQEQQKMYLRPDGSVWRVSDNPYDSLYARIGVHPAPQQQMPRETPEQLPAPKTEAKQLPLQLEKRPRKED